MTEDRVRPTRRAVRPWSLGGLFGLFLATVVASSPSIAATESGRDRPSRESARAARRAATTAGRGDAVAIALPMAGPRGVTLGLSRLFTTQFDGSAYANGNCNMAAGAMLFEVQTGRTVSGALMRRWSGARTSGTTLMDLRRAFRRQGQWIEIAEDMSWDSFFGAVRSGRSAVVQGWYGNLHSNVLQAGFSTAHSVFVLGWSSHARRGNGGFYVMDPLGSGGYDGAWWSARELRRFGWSGSPRTVGTGRRAYYGNVALQSRPTWKNLSARAYRPEFQSYWDTSKALMKRARRVNLVERSRSPFLLRVSDPHLRLSPRTARKRDLRLPLKAWKPMAHSFKVRERRLVVRTTPTAKVTVAASGRVVYRGWGLSGGRSIWVQHGRNLYTLYTGLGTTAVEPGQWVRTGRTLGRVTVNTTRKRGKKAVRSGSFRFAVAVGNPRKSWSREYPLPYLGGGSGALR